MREEITYPLFLMTARGDDLHPDVSLCKHADPESETQRIILKLEVNGRSVLSLKNFQTIKPS